MAAVVQDPTVVQVWFLAWELLHAMNLAKKNICIWETCILFVHNRYNIVTEIVWTMNLSLDLSFNFKKATIRIFMEWKIYPIFLNNSQNKLNFICWLLSFLSPGTDESLDRCDSDNYPCCSVLGPALDSFTVQFLLNFLFVVHTALMLCQII